MLLSMEQKFYSLEKGTRMRREWRETGDYAPSVYLALKVAGALETSVEALWGDG